MNQEHNTTSEHDSDVCEMSAEEIAESERIARTPLEHLYLEEGCGNLKIGDTELEGMSKEAFGGDRDCVPPEIIRSIKKSAWGVLSGTDNVGEFATPLEGASVRNAVNEYFQRCADDALRLHYCRLSGHVENLYRKLGEIKRSAPPEVTRSPAEEVAHHQAEFHRLNPKFRGVEFDALILTLEQGERIEQVTNDKIVTDKREIGRYALRELGRPFGIEQQDAVERHESYFPKRDEIERGVARSEEADDEGV
jgi:hypothetical protein